MASGSAISLLTAVRRWWSAAAGVLLLTWFTAAPAAAAKAGEVLLAAGTVTAHAEHATPRIVTTDSVLIEGEVITTAARSIAVLKLTDGTQITLRPGSEFQITHFDITEHHESAVMNLFKGGLRAVTGFMSKRNPAAMRLATPVATIGIRGTEFDARLCAGDCAAEAALRPQPAGRVGLIKGQVLARRPSGHARLLAAGSAVYSGETVVTAANAHAVIAFRDQSRVTLLSNTEFQVARMDFNAAAPETAASVFNLLRGGLRAISGLVGHQGHGYRMRTAVATIGIRGTEYDALCIGICQNAAADAGPGGDGLFAKVRGGAITLDDTYVVEANHTVFLANSGQPPLSVPDLPITLTEPLPNTVDFPPREPPLSSRNPPDGLYVSCYAGLCALASSAPERALGEDQAAYVEAAGSAAVALPEVPPFQAEDPILRAAQVGSGERELTSALRNGEFECSVQ